MGASGSKARGLWLFGSGGPGSSERSAGDQTLARARGLCSATPFVFTRRGSMYYDEDGDLAHEFYEETIITKNGRKRAKLKRIHKNLIPQGMVKLEHPRIHVDFPVIICEGRKFHCSETRASCGSEMSLQTCWVNKYSHLSMMVHNES